MDHPMSFAETQAVNEGFVARLKSGNAETISKLASVIKEELILSILREDGISRRVLAYRPISNAELQPDEKNPDVPSTLVPVEPRFGEYLATAVDFMQPSKEVWFRSRLARVYFKPIKTKMITLTEMQLLANSFPIRSYLESIAHNDILVVEDISLVEAIERCVARFAATNALATAAPLTKDIIADAKKAMSRNRLDMELVMTNEITYHDVLKWNSAEVGSLVMEPIIEFGPKGEQFKYKSWFGLKWVLTNNEDVIPENILYYLPPQRFLGVAYMLADAEQFLEFRDGILRTNTREIVARNILNPRGPIKQTLA